MGWSGNDQRRARFINQDRVDFVDDRVIVPVLNTSSEVELHVVAQIIKAEFIVGAVGNIRRIAPSNRRRRLLNRAIALSPVKFDVAYIAARSAIVVTVHSDSIDGALLGVEGYGAGQIRTRGVITMRNQTQCA